MKVEIKPTEKPGKLKEDLDRRFKQAKIQDELVIVEINQDKIDRLELVPGIEWYKTGDEKKQGLHGRPLQEQAYAKLETEEDIAKAALATIDGYNLVILNTGKKWDLKILRRYNPDIRHLKSDEPREELKINKTLEKNSENLEHIEIDIDEKEVERVIRFIQP